MLIVVTPLAVMLVVLLSFAHPLVTQKITELVSSGITGTGDVKQHLHFYVTKAVPKELGIHPKSYNRAFHPTTVDIRNHIWTVKKANGA